MVRAYNLENLFRSKSEEKFKIFIGFKNAVCINLCISTDGFKAELKVRTIHELTDCAYELFSNFNTISQLEQTRARILIHFLTVELVVIPSLKPSRKRLKAAHSTGFYPDDKAR